MLRRNMKIMTALDIIVGDCWSRNDIAEFPCPNAVKQA